ncbi:hypothetical protein GCM10027443_41720 [Pontibacter brevis]
MGFPEQIFLFAVESLPDEVLLRLFLLGQDAEKQSPHYFSCEAMRALLLFELMILLVVVENSVSAVEQVSVALIELYIALHHILHQGL